MTLKNFEDYIPSEILKRGYSYYKNYHIISLEEEDSGVWIAEVSGNDDYNVTIEIEGSDIINCDCDCPFEGDICKHIAAVLFAIRDETISSKTRHKEKSKKSKAKSIDEIFNKITKEELRDFITIHFAQNKSLKNSFFARFAEYIDDDEKSKYEIIVKNMVRASEDRYGFIEYRSANYLTGELMELLHKADNMTDKKKLYESLAICKAVIEEIPLLAGQMDDSAGGIRDLLDYSFNIFSEIAEKAPPELKDDLFKYCIEEYSKEKYHENDLGGEFLSVLPGLITTEDQGKKFLKMLDKQIQLSEVTDFTDYRVVQLLMVKINFFISRDRKQEALKIVMDNIQYPDFREIIVDEALNKKDYIKAIQLCYEGIQIAEHKKHPGTVHNWNDKLLSIYESTNNIVEIRKMTKMLFEDFYDMKYYKKLKSTYGPEEWTNICKSIIDTIKNNKSGGYEHASSLANIFIEENYKDRLLKLLQINQENLTFADEYAEHLIAIYPEELILIYEKGILKMAENTGRSYYKKVADYLKKLQKMDGGKEKVKELVDHFRLIYKNRSAMLEVLSKF